MNRDINKIIVIDWDEKAYDLQPRNALHRLKKWDGDEKDTDLVYLASFLKSSKKFQYNENLKKQNLKHFIVFLKCLQIVVSMTLERFLTITTRKSIRWKLLNKKRPLYW